MKDSVLNADDIARITSAVLKKLDGQKVDADQLNAAMENAVGSASGTCDATELLKPVPPDPAAAIRNVQPKTRSGNTRVIVASFGLNRPGIVATISNVLAENSCSIEDMSQRIMQEFYTLIMIVDIGTCKCDFAKLSEKLKVSEKKLGVTILAQHEDVFRFMHRV